MAATNIIRLEATVFGRVQGVYFRESTRARARELGVTGWVRNKRDGSVAVVAEGARPQLEQLHAYLHEGPPDAHVREVNAVWTEATGEFSSFRTRWW